MEPATPEGGIHLDDLELDLADHQPLIAIYATSLTWRAVCGTRVVWACVIGVTGAQFAFTYAPPLQKVFATSGVPFRDGLLFVGLGVVFFAILEAEKQLRLGCPSSDNLEHRRP